MVVLPTRQLFFFVAALKQYALLDAIVLNDTRLR